LRRRSIYLSGLTFFGLNLDNAPETRKDLFLQIHDICFWSQGGYDFNTVYHLPVWIRKFVLTQLKAHYDKTNNNDEANYHKSIQNLKAQQKDTPLQPNQKVLYKSGASKK
jgi:hypothetical protein